jgi:hypothetical protein
MTSDGSGWYGKVVALALAAGVLVAFTGAVVTAAPASTANVAGVYSAVVRDCRADLARRLQAPARAIKVKELRATTFSDASLNLPRPGQVYAQAITPGVTLILTHGGEEYLYTAARRTFRYGGPLSGWRLSALSIDRQAPDANLNGTLTQISLAGTNPEALLDGVDAFDPQDDGSVLVRQRTSRSGCDLLYLAPGEKGQAKTGPSTRGTRRLAGASDFGKAVLSPDHKEWATYYRVGLGMGWGLMRNHLDGKPEDAVKVDLPDSAKPGRIYWTGISPVILVTEAGAAAWYQMAPAGQASAWDKLTGFHAPDLPPFLLNKSEELQVKETTVNGKPAVSVARVWFTGDAKLLQRLDNLKLRSFQVSADLRFVLINGETPDGDRKACVVDIATAEVLPTAPDASDDLQLLNMPPRVWLEIGSVQIEPN